MTSMSSQIESAKRTVQLINNEIMENKIKTFDDLSIAFLRYQDTMQKEGKAPLTWKQYIDTWNFIRNEK